MRTLKDEQFKIFILSLILLLHWAKKKFKKKLFIEIFTLYFLNVWIKDAWQHIDKNARLLGLK